MADRSVKVDLSLDPSKYVAGARTASAATRDLEKAARNLRKANDDAENAAGALRVAEAELAKVNDDANASLTQRVRAEENHARALRVNKAAQDDLTSATKRFEAAQKSAADETSRSVKKSDDEMSRMARRTNNQFDALKFTGLSLGLPAAAAVGAAGVTVALAGAAAAFAGLGVAAAAQTPEVQRAFGQLSQVVMGDFEEMGQSVKGATLDAIDQAGNAWSRLEPQVQAAVQGSRGAITTLTGAVTDFAEGAMPGLITAVASSQPALDGLRTFAGQAGAGLSDFFRNASQGSQGASDGFQMLGSTVQLVEGRLGTLFANLANGSAGPLRSLYVIVDQATGALNNLTSQGGAAIGFLQGFSTAGGGVVTALNGVVGLLNQLPPQVSNFVGSFTAASMIAGKFGVDVGAGFDGLGKRIKDADGFSGKLKTTIGGLAQGAFNPATLAVGALGIGLEILGKKQEEAAQKAAEHAEAERDMAQAIREDGGILGAHSDAMTKQALESKNARQNLAVMGMTVDSVMDVIKGAPGAYDRYSASMHQSVAAVMASAGASQQLTDHVQKGAQAALDSGQLYKDYRNQLDTSVASNKALSDEWRKMPQAVYDQIDAISNANAAIHDEIALRKQQYDNELKVRAAMSGMSTEALRAADASNQGAAAAANLSEAWGQLAKAGGDVQAKGTAIVHLLDQMHGGMQTAEDAQQAWNDQMRQTAEGFKDLKFPNLKKDFIDTAGAINTTSEAGSKLQDWVQQATVHMAAYAQALTDTGVGADDVAKRLQPMQDQLKAQLHAFGLTDAQIQQILEHYGAIPEEISTVVKVTKADVARNQIQEITTDLMKLPANKGVNVKVLSDEAKTALLDLGYQVVQLPDGSFQIFADTQPGKDGATQLLNELRHYKVDIPIDSDTDPAATRLTQWVRQADGTMAQTTTDTRIDPATNKLQVWARQANGTWGWSNLNSRTDPATGRLQAWVMDANGRWGWVNLGARTGAAESAIAAVARDRWATIYVQTAISGPNPASLVGPRRAVAGGGFVGNAPLRKFAGGGITDVRPGGLLFGPGTGTSDSILALTSNGPARMSKGEFVEPEKRVTPWTLPILEGIRNGSIKGYASGGMVGAANELISRINSGGQVFEDFSYRGDSANLSANNDALAKLYYGQGGKFDQSSMKSWLASYASQAAVSQAIAAGAARGGGGYAGNRMGMSYRFEFGRGSGQLEQALIAWLKDTVRKRGGNVQKAFT